MMHGGALGVVGDGYPVADGRAIDTGELVAKPAGELPEPCLTAEEVIDAGAIGGNAGRNETRTVAFQLIELGCEKRSKSEIFTFTFTFERAQCLAPV
jgi:hypothetical protein